jgi:hypothetical protein
MMHLLMVGIQQGWIFFVCDVFRIQKRLVGGFAEAQKQVPASVLPILVSLLYVRLSWKLYTIGNLGRYVRSVSSTFWNSSTL